MTGIEENAQHEAIKALLKQAIQSNPNLTMQQKQIASMNLDIAAQKADWIIDMMRMCGYLK